MKVKVIHPRAAKQRGQALIELVIVIPLFLLLVLGLVAVGQLLLANYTVNQAARAAAHQAALAGGVTEAATDAAQMVIDSGVGTTFDNAEVRVTCDRSPCRRYDPITVQIAYQGDFWTPFPGFSTFTVQASATRAAERDAP